MRYSCILALVLLLAATPSAVALESQVYQIEEDYSINPIYDTALQYYYYIPCPTYAWFQGLIGWERGDMVGKWFQLGDMSTGPWSPADPLDCQTLGHLRILDLCTYGTPYPNIQAVEFDIYCSDEYGCPVGPSLWNSGTVNTGFSWNYIPIDPPLELCNCTVGPGSGPRILVTATHTGYMGAYPAWGTDVISAPVLDGCAMHDYGCLPALYPRPYNSHYTTMHSGYYGKGFEYCPPQWFKDRRDSTPDGTQYGFCELAWRIYITCAGPSESQPATWSNIKSMYR